MQHGDLVDIIPKNRKYTWSNRRLGRNNIMERLDQILVNVSFLSTFLVDNASILPFGTSYHYPTALTLESLYPMGPLPFKYSPLWNDIEAAKVLVQQTWCQHFKGSPSFIWERKLRNVKNAHKNWAKTQYEEPKAKKREVKDKIEELHYALEKQEYYQAEKNQEENLYSQLYSIRREEEEKWRIKSRQTWLKSGDRNTTFFHKQANVWKIRNNITTITDNAGTQHNDQTTIKNVASKHFKDLLTKSVEEENYTDFQQHLPKKIVAESNERSTRGNKRRRNQGSNLGPLARQGISAGQLSYFFL